ncbi:unnamed protein product [Cylindrotheca closterium]|uniref:Uncharacterized protein n=1 Tax=Cylindrotheca closterium TaxID=2856 RepID=A0AAD2G9M3_9STRA|nr:unnamed protein product [Cylindrotheca closterium]
MSYLDSDVKSGDWTIPLGDNDAVNAFLDAIERNPNTVAAQVDLILNSEGPSSDGNELTQPQAARLVHLVKSRKSVDWGHLRLGFRSECPHLLFCTTQLAPLFSKISASAYDSASDSSGCLPLSTAHSILNALQHGNRLQELALCFCVIQEDRMELLSQGIQSTSCPLRSLYLRDVECDHAAHVENKNRRSEPFVLALTKNTTLEDVTFISSFTSTQDVTLVDLFYQMSNTQPPIRWKKLFIVGSDLGKFAQIQDQTVRLVDRLTRMLSHRDCSIVELCLQNCSLGFHYNNTHGRGILQSLMSGVQENSSIQVLNLNNNAFSLADLQFILDGISGCPNLRELELCEEHASLNVPENQNTSWLTNSRLMLPRPGTNLNKLWICDHFPLCNIYDYEDYEEYISSGSHRFMTDAELEAVLLPLLVYNPFICDLGRGLNWRGMPRAAEVLDLNQCLGALRTPPSPAQDQETTESPLSHIPLSLWPTVLERTSKTLKDPARCANVVHHILKRGPGVLDG